MQSGQGAVLGILVFLASGGLAHRPMTKHGGIVILWVNQESCYDAKGGGSHGESGVGQCSWNCCDRGSGCTPLGVSTRRGGIATDCHKE